MLKEFQLSPIIEKGQNIADFAYKALCESIVEGKLKPGQRLREVEIAEDLGISRTPIREALRRIEALHLLTRQPNGAYFVAVWDKRTLWELATLRSNLEGLAISLAISNFLEEDYLCLEELIVKMDRVVQHKEYDKLILLDAEFHRCIWSCSKHNLLQETLLQILPQVNYMMMLTKQGEEDTFPDKHREIITALRQGDPVKAMDVVQTHILEAAKHLISQYKY